MKAKPTIKALTAQVRVLAQVQTLRAEGEALHKAGNHGESVKVLAEALKLLEASE